MNDWSWFVSLDMLRSPRPARGAGFAAPLPFVPSRLNAGHWLVDYSYETLAERLREVTPVLPICSFAHPPAEVASLGELVLPPLFHEGLDEPLQRAMLDRIRECFPFHELTGKRAGCHELEIIELPRASPRDRAAFQASQGQRPRVLALSIDTAVEEHGPHLPLATDRIQCYAALTGAVLGEAGASNAVAPLEGVMLGPPVDYGHLVWGLPMGLSIDIPPPLLSAYVARLAAAAVVWSGADSLYVVDVHGSLAHRQAIQAGLAASGVGRWKFRWLFEPLMPYAGERGDQHAGGVETVVIEAIDPQLVDRVWWPSRRAELQAGQMSVEKAADLSADLPRFFAYARETRRRGAPWNGIVGKIENAETLDGPRLLQMMIDLARADLIELLGS